MSTPLRVLIIEDSEPDAHLLLRQLKLGGFEPQSQRVESAAGLTTALAAQEWDAIISDYRLPQFTGLDALRLVQASGRDIPFILVSGAIGEEQAAAVMKAGAHDFVLKDRLAQLPLSVERELRDAEERRQRKQAKDELFRLNRILLAQSDCIHALLHTKTETELLHNICRIITEDCGYVMVWIGYAEADQAKSVRPVASAGYEDGYLETIKLSWDETKLGSGPTGIAIRSGQPCQCADFLSDPNFAPWRTEALMRGYASSLVLPLLGEGKAFGAVTIYSRYTGSFSENEVKLLCDLANDLAYGIAALRSREARRQAEAALHELNHELESRVAERTSELQAAVHALQSQITERQRLEREILKISEYEQSRIGQDLHDGACQNMACVAVLADVALREMNRENSTTAARLREISELARQSMDEVRRLAAGLFPVKIEQQGLEGALKELVSTTTVRSDTTCNLILRQPINFISQNAAIQLYRIAQEALNNALRHGKARNVTMELDASDGTVCLSIRDDGSGMPNQPKNSGLGLHTMEYRARTLGGSLNISSEAGRGTTVTCSFPGKELTHAQENIRS